MTDILSIIRITALVVLLDLLFVLEPRRRDVIAMNLLRVDVTNKNHKGFSVYDNQFYPVFPIDEVDRRTEKKIKNNKKKHKQPDNNDVTDDVTDDVNRHVTAGAEIRRREETIRTFKTSMLRLLGLKSEPNPRGTVRVPKHMIDLYRENAASNRRRRRDNAEGPVDPSRPGGRGKMAPFHGNTIRSFASHFLDMSEKKKERVRQRMRKRQRRKPRSVLDEGEGNIWGEMSGTEEGEPCLSWDGDFVEENFSYIFQFNFSSSDGAEELQGAELRVYRKGSEEGLRGERTGGSERDLILDEDKNHRVRVYEVLQTPGQTPGVPGVGSDRKVRLLDTRLIDTDQARGGWEVFEVSPAISEWINLGGDYRGLLEIRVTTEDGLPVNANKYFRLRKSEDIPNISSLITEHDSSLSDIDNPNYNYYVNNSVLSSSRSIVNSVGKFIDYELNGKYGAARSRRSPDPSPRPQGPRTPEAEDADEPFLVTYSEDVPESDHATVKKRRKNRASGTKKTRDSKQTKNKGSSSSSLVCKRRSLYVDFVEIGWNNWVIAPPGYDAFLCVGVCPTLLPDHLNATNHAQVQTFLHSIDSSAVPPPCCVPTELSPISLLYVDDMDKVVLRNYQDMVVEACGCQ